MSWECLPFSFHDGSAKHRHLAWRQAGELRMIFEDNVTFLIDFLLRDEKLLVQEQFLAHLV